MQVRPRAAAAIANVPNDVATVDFLAGDHGEAGKMAVKRAQTMPMLQNDGAAIAVHEIRITHHGIGGSDDGRTLVAGNIDPGVKRAFTIKRVNAFPE